MKQVNPLDSMILTLRGRKVIVDSDLAALYEAPTKALNQAIKRNAERFPEDFAFRLTREEKVEVVTICDHLARLKYSPALPMAFTEHGAALRDIYHKLLPLLQPPPDPPKRRIGFTAGEE